jgi:hypothetical protein
VGATFGDCGGLVGRLCGGYVGRLWWLSWEIVVATLGEMDGFFVKIVG